MRTDPLVVASGVALLGWIYLLLARGGFWRVRVLKPKEARDNETRRVAIVVPARNEAGVIARSITSLLRQTYCGPVHIYLVDDNSTDGTADTARAAAQAAGGTAGLTIIVGEPLPAGWTGKVWAQRQGMERAREFQPDFILLTDADIVHAPDALVNLVATADTGYDLVSLMALLHCESVAEKLLIPAFVFFFSKLYPPAWIADSRHSTAGAAGGCILIRPEALARAGGLESLRNEVIDDCALARHVKRSGGKLRLDATTSTVSIRPYGSFASIGRMISRCAFNQLHHSVLLLAGALIGMVVIYLLPPALLFTGRLWPMTLGGLTWALMTIAFIPTVRHFRLSPLWAMTLPLAAFFFMGATFHSALKYWFGHGGEWKGRVQDVADLAPSRERPTTEPPRHRENA